jgi:hypothetical protein
MDSPCTPFVEEEPLFVDPFWSFPEDCGVDDGSAMLPTTLKDWLKKENEEKIERWINSEHTY